MGDTFARATRRENRVRRKIPEKKTARLCLGRGVGRERFSIRARSGVGGGIQLELDYLHTGDKSFVSSWGYYPYGRGKEGRGERGREREAPSAQEHAQVNL
jgi:hypothetical protein